MSYRLIFDYSNIGLPPTLANMQGAPIYYDGYLIGSALDPHWVPYSPAEFPAIRNVAPMGSAATDYVYGPNQYAMYRTGWFEHDAIRTYGMLLRKHLEPGIVAGIQAQERRRKEELKRVIDNKIKNLRASITRTKGMIQKENANYKTQKGKLDANIKAKARSIRTNMRKGISEEEAERLYDIELGASSRDLESNVNFIKDNIDRLTALSANYTNELENYKSYKLT
tara:strand:+ start:149 stop:823 length:675 start_codon:yes stop_codon:yes gene_type:complete